MVARRYGIMPSSLRSSPISDYVFDVGCIGPGLNQEAKDRLIEQAFNAWLQSGSDLTFNAFIDKIGLGESGVAKRSAAKRAGASDPKAAAERARQRAAEIMKLDSKRRVNSGD